jgi:TolB-like protein
MGAALKISANVQKHRAPERGMPFVFENCRLDQNRRELTRDSATVSLGPQVFDVLLHLVQNRNRVVTKDELLETVWRGRIVSESTLTSHINAARKAIGDNGHDQRLIKTVARKGFRFVADARPARSTEVHDDDPAIASAAEPAAAALRLPDKPSIAVLPFVNLSGDSAQDYFADGVVEDIITALSRIRWLFIIARNSSFIYKGRAVDVKQIGRELGVRYVLEGSIRKSANRVRITGQLIDASTGGHLWAERYEGSLNDIFDLQDQLTESVVGAIEPQLERAEIERALHKPTESLDAYDCYLRGMASFHQRGREAVSEALSMFYKALERDPAFAAAYGMAAWCIFWRKINGWMTDPAQEIAEGARLARRAVELGRNDAVTLTRGGHVLAHFGGRIDDSIALVDEAIALDPNHATAWIMSGFLRALRGEPDEAIERFKRAMRLSPMDSEMFRMQFGMALSHFVARRFDEALTWAEKAFREWPGFALAIAFIAASHALAGRTDEAQRAAEHFRKLDPTRRLSTVGSWIPFHRPEDVAMLMDGLRKAGVPE